MDNVKDRHLSFPQRNWLLLCILIAILSPLVVHWIQVGAHREAYRQAMDQRPPANTTASGATDTSYKVASPPSNDTSKKGGGADSAAH